MSLHTYRVSRDRMFANGLAEEHKALATEVVLLKDVADEIATAPHDRLPGAIDRAFVLLAERIAAHVTAERALRTRLARRDYCRVDSDVERSEADRLTRQLGALKARLAPDDTGATLEEIRHLLYELHALTRLHFADELQRPAGGAPAGI